MNDDVASASQAAPVPVPPASAPDERSTEAAAPALPPSPVDRSRRIRQMVPFLFLVLTQPLLLVVVIVPAWWAALPVLAVWGVVGWRNRWIWAPLAGFALGFGFWTFELLLLPAAPRERLAAVIGAGLGASPTVALVIGPLLFGVLAAMAALTVAGALRTWEDLRAPSGTSPSPTIGSP
jgi:hypothetical protein